MGEGNRYPQRSFKRGLNRPNRFCSAAIAVLAVILFLPGCFTDCWDAILCLSPEELLERHQIVGIAEVVSQKESISIGVIDVHGSRTPLLFTTLKTVIVQPLKGAIKPGDTIIFCLSEWKYSEDTSYISERNFGLPRIKDTTVIYGDSLNDRGLYKALRSAYIDDGSLEDYVTGAARNEGSIENWQRESLDSLYSDTTRMSIAELTKGHLSIVSQEYLSATIMQLGGVYDIYYYGEDNECVGTTPAEYVAELVSP